MQVEHQDLDRRFLAGRVGDLAAIGDWNCDGTPTLGVLRPSTGAWFTFGSWEADVVSTSEIIASPYTTRSELTSLDLVVEIDATGCAQPMVSSSTTG